RNVSYRNDSVLPPGPVSRNDEACLVIPPVPVKLRSNSKVIGGLSVYDVATTVPDACADAIPLTVNDPPAPKNGWLSPRQMSSSDPDTTTTSVRSADPFRACRPVTIAVMAVHPSVCM